MMKQERWLGNIPRREIKAFKRDPRYSMYKSFRGPVKTGPDSLTRAQLEEDGYVGMWTHDPVRRV